MDDRKTFLDYIGQMLSVLGAIVVIFIVLGKTVGDGAANISTLYSLGSEGISFHTLLQFLLLASLLTFLRFFFFTDTIIKAMSIAGRTVGMFASIIVVIVVMAICFAWFPVDNIHAWIGFFISFAVCAGGSLLIATLKEKGENRKLEEALKLLQKEK